MMDGLLFPMTHDELVKKAAKWLKKTVGCNVVFTELVTSANETPDAIGFRDGYSVLVEAKTSRSDFHADKKKIFRQCPEQGMGDYRFFICEPGLIELTDLPAGWGLLWAFPKIIKQKRGFKNNIRSDSEGAKRFSSNLRAERKLLISVARRMQFKGFLEYLTEPITKQFKVTEIK